MLAVIVLCTFYPAVGMPSQQKDKKYYNAKHGYDEQDPKASYRIVDVGYFLIAQKL